MPEMPGPLHKDPAGRGEGQEMGLGSLGESSSTHGGVGWSLFAAEALPVRLRRKPTLSSVFGCSGHSPSSLL
eukprot:4975406-Pyramimonas_sp.AAC.1